MWGPYLNTNFSKWERNEVEKTHTQFLKRILGCNIQTSNNMIRGEVGNRPLLIDVIKRVVAYTKNIKERPTSTVSSAYDFESTNDITQIFVISLINFN